MDITAKEYRVLFNSITDAISVLESLLSDLVQAQQFTEEIIISRTCTAMPEESN